MEKPRTIGNLDIGQRLCEYAITLPGLMNCSGKAVIVDSFANGLLTIAKAVTMGMDAQTEFLYKIRLRIEDEALQKLIITPANGKLPVAYKGNVLGIINSKPHSPKLWIAVTDIKVISKEELLR